MDQVEINLIRNSDGTITINSEGFSRTIWVRSLTPEKKYEALREAILESGFVFSEKAEKMARKIVGFKPNS
jgi:hypothetical protein